MIFSKHTWLLLIKKTKFALIDVIHKSDIFRVISTFHDYLVYIFNRQVCFNSAPPTVMRQFA